MEFLISSETAVREIKKRRTKKGMEISPKKKKTSENVHSARAPYRTS